MSAGGDGGAAEVIDFGELQARARARRRAREGETAESLLHRLHAAEARAREAEKVLTGIFGGHPQPPPEWDAAYRAAVPGECAVFRHGNHTIVIDGDETWKTTAAQAWQAHARLMAATS